MWNRLAAAAGIIAAAAVTAALGLAFDAFRRRKSKSRKACGNVVAGFPGCIGNTPMLEIQSLSKATGCRILGKAEFLNPGGSSKDRVALRMVQEAEEAGELKPGGVIVEGSAGSTGISLALMARARGYGCTIVLPDDMSVEKCQLLERFGATVLRVPAVSIVNNAHYCKKAEQIAADTPGGFYANQFENTANFRAHYTTTGPEIWEQTNGSLDGFVMASGTGGTISGVAAYLKSVKPEVQVCLIDPPGSALYNKVACGVLYAPEQAERTLRRNRYDTITEGIGIDRMTENFNQGWANIDHAYKGTDQEAVEMAHYLLHHDGLFVGSSSAMNCVGAVRLARQLGPGHTIVTVLCDSGQRSMSKLFNPEFLQARDLSPMHAGASLAFIQ